MTPNEMDKLLTDLMAEDMNSVGFKKKKTGSFFRIINGCKQCFNISFTRDRGLPGTMYSMYPTLIFQFPAVDELHCLFMGREYDKREKAFGTGSKSLYTLVPGKDSFRYKYCSNDPMEQQVHLLFNDFVEYALPFFDKYDSLEKIEKYFDENSSSNIEGFSVIRSQAYGCCIAATLCANNHFNKCKKLIETDDQFSSEQSERIMKYIREHE